MNSARESGDILKMLVAGRSPEDEARLALAYEKFGKGDPNSLPSLFTLMDMNSLRCHAALLEEQQRMLATFTDVAAKMTPKTATAQSGKTAPASAGSPVVPLFVGILLGGAAVYFYVWSQGGVESNLKKHGALVEYKETLNARKEPVFVLEIKASGKRTEGFTSASGTAVTVIPIRK